MMILDLHVHTSHGSGDSNLSPDELAQEARRIGLHGACLTEHGGMWDPWEFGRFADRHPDLLLVPALEVETDMGHVTAFGLNGYVSGIHDLRELRRVAQEVGGYLVAAHPFRRYFDAPSDNLLFRELEGRPKSVEKAMAHPVFALVDAIEVANGANTEEENGFALQVARRLGKPVVGGSDAHSVQGLGRCVTVFPERLDSPDAFLRAIQAGKFYAAARSQTGRLEPYTSR